MSLALQHPDGFVRCPKAICHVSKVDKGGEVAISLGQFWRSHCITDYRNLEPLLQKFPQMELDAHIREHPRENDLVDALLAELEG